jgi:hypothetical protein
LIRQNVGRIVELGEDPGSLGYGRVPDRKLVILLPVAVIVVWILIVDRALPLTSTSATLLRQVRRG